MSKDRRRGARKDRKRKIGSREPELGYYLVVTDTKETEKHYFEGIRNTIPEELRGRLVIKVEKAATVDLVRRAVELRDQDPQYRIPWIEIWFFSYFKKIPNIISSVACCSKYASVLNHSIGGEHATCVNGNGDKRNRSGQTGSYLI